MTDSTREVEDLAIIEIIPTPEDPRSLSLRTRIAEGTTDNGKPFELDLSGGVLMLTVGEWDDEDRIRQTISWEDLVKAWLRSVGEVDD